MSIRECFPMKKHRFPNSSKTPKRSPCDTRQQRRQTQAEQISSDIRASVQNSVTEQPGLEIMWDNQSPSPGTVLKFGKRKKKHGSDSSSGGEISDLVRKLADKSGATPEANPLLKFWMYEDIKDQQKEKGTRRRPMKQKSSVVLTPARRPSRRSCRRSNRTKVKQLSKELELLAHHMKEPGGDELVGEEINVHEKRDGSINHASNLATATCTRNIIDANPATTEELDLFDMWESDGSDELLSQIDLAVTENIATCAQETQVFTHTQILCSKEDVGQEAVQSEDAREEQNDEQQNLIVTEAWDFVEDLANSDGEEFLQTALEDFEKSQDVFMSKQRTSDACLLPLGTESNTSGNYSIPNSASATTTVGQYQNSLTKGVGLHTKNKHKDNLTGGINGKLKHISASVDNTNTDTHVCAATLVPCKSSRDLKNTENQVCSHHSVTGKNSTYTQNHSKENWASHGANERDTRTVPKYTKEDIERKRMLAQQKRRQRMGQFPKRKS